MESVAAEAIVPRTADVNAQKSKLRALQSPLGGVAAQVVAQYHTRVGILRVNVPASAFNGAIDWSRLAEPQADQYDTDVILRLASRRSRRAERSCTGERRSVSRRPHSMGRWRFVTRAGRCPNLLRCRRNIPTRLPITRTSEHAAEHVRSWPVGFAQCQRLLEAIHPATHPQMPLESTDIYRGSLCHSFERLFGTIWATIFCPTGLAEAIVHEMAHQKLRVLGVSVESATAVVGNNPSNLYASPVIKDR